MSAEMKVEGFEQLSKRISELGNKAGRIENAALIRAAEPILQDAKANCKAEEKERLKISKVKKKAGQKYVLVGVEKYQDLQDYILRFIEFGTAPHSIKVYRNDRGLASVLLKSTKNEPFHHPGTAPHPFLRPAYEQNKSNVIEIIKKEFKRELGLK